MIQRMTLQSDMLFVFLLDAAVVKRFHAGELVFLDPVTNNSTSPHTMPQRTLQL